MFDRPHHAVAVHVEHVRIAESHVGRPHDVGVDVHLFEKQSIQPGLPVDDAGRIHPQRVHRQPCGRVEAQVRSPDDPSQRVGRIEPVAAAEVRVGEPRQRDQPVRVQVGEAGLVGDLPRRAAVVAQPQPRPLPRSKLLRPVLRQAGPKLAVEFAGLEIAPCEQFVPADRMLHRGARPRAVEAGPEHRPPVDEEVAGRVGVAALDRSHFQRACVTVVGIHAEPETRFGLGRAGVQGTLEAGLLLAAPLGVRPVRNVPALRLVHEASRFDRADSEDRVHVVGHLRPFHHPLAFPQAVLALLQGSRRPASGRLGCPAVGDDRRIRLLGRDARGGLGKSQGRHQDERHRPTGAFFASAPDRVRPAFGGATPVRRRPLAFPLPRFRGMRAGRLAGCANGLASTARVSRLAIERREHEQDREQQTRCRHACGSDQQTDRADNSACNRAGDLRDARPPDSVDATTHLHDGLGNALGGRATLDLLQGHYLHDLHAHAHCRDHQCRHPLNKAKQAGLESHLCFSSSGISLFGDAVDIPRAISRQAPC